MYKKAKLGVWCFAHTDCSFRVMSFVQLSAWDEKASGDKVLDPTWLRPGIAYTHPTISHKCSSTQPNLSFYTSMLGNLNEVGVKIGWRQGPSGKACDTR